MIWFPITIKFKSFFSHKSFSNIFSCAFGIFHDDFFNFRIAFKCIHIVTSSHEKFNILQWLTFFLLKSLAKRPPVEETASFLQSLLASHGPNYLEKLFGSKARDALAPLGGVEKVAIALSESQTIEGK